MTHAADGDSRRGLALVGLAVLFFSTTPVLIRWSAPLTGWEIAWGRLAVATTAVWALATLRGERPRLALSDLPRLALFGLVTALHFWFYISSLSYTTVAHSLTLTYTSPIFVAILSALLLGEKLAGRKYLGVLAAVLGVAVMAGFEPAFTSRMALGDLLALGSAVCFGFYSVAGRSQRARYPLLTYAFGVYGMAALWLTPAVLLWPSGGWGAPQTLSVLALGVFPLALGHTLYNAALRYTHAAYVNLVATQEVTGGVALSALLLGEVPGMSTVLGILTTLGGIVLVLL
ncbi:MAG: DMT family transporter [Chloroflexi bacterium]|nr:DMT family transporter [Chloroflexota bacterium]